MQISILQGSAVKHKQLGTNLVGKLCTDAGITLHAFSERWNAALLLCDFPPLILNIVSIPCLVQCPEPPPQAGVC